MVDSLIPGIIDDIVRDKIIPLLPLHTRPLVRVLNGAWRESLDAIGVPLNPNGRCIAEATRSRQPLKCRLAIAYIEVNDTDDNRENGWIVKLFDGEWRNVAPISGRGPYTCPNPIRISVLGVVDGRLYLGEWRDGGDRTTRIIVLDVGGGLWQWQEVCRRENYGALLSYPPIYICRSRRPAGELYVYRKYERYHDIIEIPECQHITFPPNQDLLDIEYIPRPTFAQLGNLLYFFGSFPYTQRARFFDMNNQVWNNGIVEAHDGGSLNVERNVVLVAYDVTHFDILRYDFSNERWIRAAWMLPPPGIIMCWTWCVEYDDEGEKQLWIYIWRGGAGFSLCKWQAVERLREGRMMGKVWDDVVLPGGGLVECQLVNRTPLERPFELLNNGITAYSRIHGFHRSDSIDFEDIPSRNP